MLYTIKVHEKEITKFQTKSDSHSLPDTTKNLVRGPKIANNGHQKVWLYHILQETHEKQISKSPKKLTSTTSFHPAPPKSWFLAQKWLFIECSYVKPLECP